MLIFKILRDNPFMNLLGRTFIKWLAKFVDVIKLMNGYRVYGIIGLEMEGVRFDVYARGDDFIANEIYYGLGYEQPEFSLVKALATEARVLIDAGANSGIFSLFAAAVNPALTIICFEPHPGNFRRLVTNIGLNKFTRIRPKQFALGDCDRDVTFTIPADGSLSTTSSVTGDFTRKFHKIPFKEITVQQVRLDHALADVQLTSHDLIKIDVEFYELNVLLGATKILDEIRPMLLIEILSYDALTSQHPEMAGRLPENYAQRIHQLLISKGYFCYLVLSNGILRCTDFANARNRNFFFITQDFGMAEISLDRLVKKIKSVH